MVAAPASSFPIAGVLHLLFTPSLWGSVCCVLVLGILLAFITTLLLFIFTLDDHADWFDGGSAHWWAWVLAVLAVLLESLCLTIVILKVTHTRVQVKLFVATMRQKGRWDDRRMVTPSIVPGLCKLRFLVRLVTLPLNLIPVAGNILYAYINAPFEAKEAMDMYFDAIQLNDRQRWIEIYGSPRQACCDMYSSSKYLHYGFVATLLESIPIAGPTIFNLSNACGAALWACQMEAETGGPPSLLTAAAATTTTTAPPQQPPAYGSATVGGGGDGAFFQQLQQKRQEP